MRTVDERFSHLMLLALGLVSANCASTTSGSLPTLPPSSSSPPPASAEASSPSPARRPDCHAAEAAMARDPVESTALALRRREQALEPTTSSSEPPARVCVESLIQSYRAAVREYLAAALSSGVTEGERNQQTISEALLGPLGRVDARRCRSADEETSERRTAAFAIVGAERPVEKPEWLAVQTEGLARGGTDPAERDTALYVFRFGDNRWNLALADETTEPCSESGCRSNDGPTLVGLSEPNGPYIASLYFPRCGESRPGIDLELQVLAVGNEPLSPRRILRDDLGPAGMGAIDGGPPGTILERPHGLDVVFWTVGSETRQRQRIFRACEATAHYTMAGGNVRRAGRIDVRRASCRTSQ